MSAALTRLHASITGSPLAPETALEAPAKDFEGSSPLVFSVPEDHRETVTATVHIPLSSPCLADVLVTLPHPLHATAEAIYRTLHALAVEFLEVKNQPRTVAQVVIHQSAEVLAAYVGVSLPTLYKYLKQMRALGLVAFRGHTGSYYNLSRKTGTLFAVSLKPGHRAKIHYADMRHEYRDLTSDIEENRTAWAFLKRFKGQKKPEGGIRLEDLAAWALKPGQFDKNPSLSDPKNSTAEVVYSLDMLPSTHKSKRAELVDKYAQALALGFLDAPSLNFWRWLLWRGIAGDAQGLGTMRKLQHALTRLQVDLVEWDGLRTPAALLVSRLKQSGIWDELNFSA